MVCLAYFKVSKVVWCKCFGLFGVNILAFFDLETVWATFLKNWPFFISNLLATLFQEQNTLAY
jgi:hypothetical protein